MALVNCSISSVGYAGNHTEVNMLYMYIICRTKPPNALLSKSIWSGSTCDVPIAADVTKLNLG